MAQDISGLYISQSFQNLVQRSASGAFNVLATATGTEFIPVSASYAISASKADSVVSASYALSSSRAVSASRADSALSASYALSSSYAVTASFALNAQTANLQEVLTAGNSASVNMILTSSLLTTSSLTEHKNEFKVTAQDKDTDFDVANFIIKNSGAGVTKITGSVNISGSEDVTGRVTMNDFKAAASSTVGDVSGASANLDIGSGTNPNRYGNFQIFQNSDTHTGNYFSAFQIIDGGGLTAALANSAFTGLGNEIHYISMGANSPGRSDNIKLYASGSDSALNTPSNVNMLVNNAGSDPTLTIEDKANNSFSLGPRIKFTGSRVGKVETDSNMNLQMEIGQDFIQNIGRQYTVTLGNFTSGDFKIEDQGSRSARYIHENVIETGSIRFANTTEDVGIGLRMDDAGMELQMYSGSAFHSIIRRASGSQQVNLYDSSRSTGSADQVLKSNANGGIEWSAEAGVPFPYTGSAQITGSLVVTGSISLGNVDSLNIINPAAQGAFVHGDGNNIVSSGEDNFIGGGESNVINGGGYSAILGAASSQMNNVDTSVILGGYQQNIQGSRTFAVGGNQNVINNNTDFSGIMGGQSNQIIGGVTASAIIGGKNIQATKNEAVYVPSLEVVSGGANITGSILGGGSLQVGQQAGAFSSDAITLGNATTPVQYGNFQIYQNTTTNTGNYFNGIQIVDAGAGPVTELANSAFTGLGNNIQYIGIGANSPGRSDNIKMWCSGSSDVIHFASTASFDEVVVLMPNLPTSNPGVTGQLWNDSGTLKIS